MKCSLGISNILKKFLVFPVSYFTLFLCISHWERLSYLSYPPSMWMGTSAPKLKDAWKKSYEKPRQHIKKQRYYFDYKSPYSGFRSGQWLSCVQLSVNPWTAARQASLSITNSQSLLKLMFIKSVMDNHQPSSHLILCHPLLLPPSVLPTIRVFSSELVLPIRWPKYWSFSFNIIPSSEYSGLTFFRIDWFDFLAVQRTFKSLLQHHSSKASVHWCSAFFMLQLLYPYMTGKTIALTRWIFVGKVMSLLFNMLSRLVIAFLPRSKHLLISWLQ